MGIFDFFKKFAKKKEVEEILIEKLRFSKIEDWIENKRKENDKKEEEILLKVREKIEDFIEELNEKIIILKEIDVEGKKEKDQIKNIVMDSKEKYIESVEDLVEKLNNLEEPKLEKFVERINKIFSDFNKSSFKNYERATILIGKEMANVRESLRSLSRDLLKTFEENKNIVSSFKKLMIVKEKLDAVFPIDKTLKEISNEELSLDKKIIEKQKENKLLKEEVEKIKISLNYLERLETQKIIESLKEESKDYIIGLKQLLDFKALASFFHINPEQMKMVKDYREDFYTHFIKDNGKSIISLLDEAKLNNEKIVEKIEKIGSKLEEARKHEQEIKEDETREVYIQIKEIDVEIDNLELEKIKEEKREEKLKVNKGELVSSLKQELSKMNVEIV